MYTWIAKDVTMSTLSSLLAPEVVIMANSCAPSDDEIGIWRLLVFQCSRQKSRQSSLSVVEQSVFKLKKISPAHTLPAKMEYLESTMETLIFYILISRNGLAPTTNKYCATLTCSFLTKKCNLHGPKFKTHNRMYMDVSFFNTSCKISHNVQGSIHSAASSNDLLDLHSTQTQTCEVRWGARFSGHWVVTSMFA